MGSFRPVLLAYGVAIGAFPAGVAWIHNDDGDAHPFCLVFDERPELIKRPRVVDVPVALPNGCPHPDFTEVFNGNCGRGAFCCLNDLLRYYMVGVPGKPALRKGEAQTVKEQSELTGELEMTRGSEYFITASIARELKKPVQQE